MNFWCLGMNYLTAPVEIREKWAVAEGKASEVIQKIKDQAGLSECVLLSTCNRVEIYAIAEDQLTGGELIQKVLKIFDPESTDIPEGILYQHEGRNAVHHLCQVAGGLDSMVLGETEIFGQVKKAYLYAKNHGQTGGYLNPLFQKIFRVGKTVRNSTGIQHGSTSVGSVAVDLAEKIFGNLKKSRVMILGAGEMARTVGQSLNSRGAKGVVVSNRSYDKAVELAEKIGGKALKFDQWSEQIDFCDVILCSTSAPHILLTKEMVFPVMKKRKGRALFIVDIAVPRDADPELHEIEGVYLYDIDHLEAIAEEAKKLRGKQIDQCKVVIEKEIEKMVQSRNSFQDII